MKVLCTKQLLAALAVASLYIQTIRTDNYAHTIFVPRQMAYNPIYEDALVFAEYAHTNNHFLFSFKPIYTQTVGGSIKKYFNIDHLPTMNVEEDGSGNIDPLWFQVIAASNTFYSSTLSFAPVQKTAGALFYVAWMLPNNFAITVNTAFVKRKNNMHISETITPSNNIGQLPGFSSVTQSFANTQMEYGKIAGSQSKSGVDDIQIKVLKNITLCEDESFFGDIYGLIGIPTGHGSKAIYLFEPMVGSHHVQFGLGFNAEKSFDFHLTDQVSLYGECKWRYGLKAKETRSFDMTPNGQWSRYMLFTTPTATADQFPAINDLTFKADVTPGNSFDLLLASHVEVSRFNFELGYNFWYRQAEKVSPYMHLPEVGIADLRGIAQLNNPVPVTVTSSSKATISEGVYPNQYQMPRDGTYTLVTADNINPLSGAQAASCTNAVFGSIGYEYGIVDMSLNVAYEGAANKNSVSVVSLWVNADVRF